MTSLFVLYREVLSPSVNTDSLPMDSFLATVQCRIPRHKVPHFKVKVLKRWGRSGYTGTGYFISQYIKATAGGPGAPSWYTI